MLFLFIRHFSVFNLICLTFIQKFPKKYIYKGFTLAASSRPRQTKTAWPKRPMRLVWFGPSPNRPAPSHSPLSLSLSSLSSHSRTQHTHTHRHARAPHGTAVPPLSPATSGHLRCRRVRQELRPDLLSRLPQFDLISEPNFARPRLKCDAAIASTSADADHLWCRCCTARLRHHLLHLLPPPGRPVEPTHTRP